MDEQREAFNQQISEWSAKQGLWFQLRHISGETSPFSWLARMAIRLAIFLALCAIGSWFFLSNYVESDKFKESIRSGVEETLNGSECEIGSIKKDNDIITISNLDMSQTDTSFFHKLHAKKIKLNMGLKEGLLRKWSGGALSIDYLNINLKSGESDGQKAASSYASLFPEFEKFKFEHLDVKKGDLHWGYSAHNKGSIKNSHITVNQENKGWRIVFKGGLFSQNWIKRLNIVKIEALCTEEGLQIESAELNSGKATLKFQATIGSGEQPEVKGSMVFKSLPLETLLPSRYSSWIQGSVSGKGKIFGSTNTQHGIGMNINLSLNQKDSIAIRDYYLPILKVFNRFDHLNDYHNIVFTKGGFDLVTGGGKMKVNKIDLKAEKLLELKGGFDVRQPDYKEVAQKLGSKDLSFLKSIFQLSWSFEDEIVEVNDSSTDLVDAVKNMLKVTSKSKNYITPDQTDRSSRLMAQVLTEKIVLRFNGNVQAGLRVNVFDQAPKLREKYSPDLIAGRTWIDIPLESDIRDLTLKQADELYALEMNSK